MVDGVLLAIGGRGVGEKKTSAIYAFSHTDQKWHWVGDMPFECSYADTLQLPGKKLFLIDGADTLQLPGGKVLLVDGVSQRVLRITVEGKIWSNKVVLNY